MKFLDDHESTPEAMMTLKEQFEIQSGDKVYCYVNATDDRATLFIALTRENPSGGRNIIFIPAFQPNGHTVRSVGYDEVYRTEAEADGAQLWALNQIEKAILVRMEEAKTPVYSAEDPRIPDTRDAGSIDCQTDKISVGVTIDAAEIRRKLGL